MSMTSPHYLRLLLTFWKNLPTLLVLPGKWKFHDVTSLFRGIAQEGRAFEQLIINILIPFLFESRGGVIRIPYFIRALRVRHRHCFPSSPPTPSPQIAYNKLALFAQQTTNVCGSTPILSYQFCLRLDARSPFNLRTLHWTSVWTSKSFLAILGYHFSHTPISYTVLPLLAQQTPILTYHFSTSKLLY